jgi:Putative stress-induced transcription regulator
VDFESYTTFAVDLVSSEPDELEAADPLSSLNGLRSFLATWPWMARRADAKDLAPLVRLRGELRAVFDDAGEGRSAAMVDRINHLLARHRPQPTISGHDDVDWHLHIADDRGPSAPSSPPARSWGSPWPSSTWVPTGSAPAPTRVAAAACSSTPHATAPGATAPTAAPAAPTWRPTASASGPAPADEAATGDLGAQRRIRLVQSSRCSSSWVGWTSCAISRASTEIAPACSS